MCLQEIDLKNHRWGHYFVCGYKGFHEYAKSAGLDVGSPVGLDVIIDVTVPTGICERSCEAKLLVLLEHKTTNSCRSIFRNGIQSLNFATLLNLCFLRSLQSFCQYR